VPQNIQFVEGKPRYIFERDCLEFRALVDGRDVECLVTGELLMHRFGARAFTEDAFREAFTRHESEIHAIAQHHIEMGWINPENLVILTTRFTTLKVKLGEELRKRNRELEMAGLVLRLLAQVIGPGSGEVTAELDWEEKEGRPILVIILDDAVGGAANWFYVKELESESAMRVQLARLWGDFLQIRAQKLIQRSG
jgi:hypothetical protein